MLITSKRMSGSEFQLKRVSDALRNMLRAGVMWSLSPAWYDSIMTCVSYDIKSEKSARPP